MSADARLLEIELLSRVVEEGALAIHFLDEVKPTARPVVVEVRKEVVSSPRPAKFVVP